MNRSLRVLIVYGTSFGATKGTSQEVARILREKNFEVKVVNDKRKKSKTSLSMGWSSWGAAWHIVDGMVRPRIF